MRGEEGTDRYLRLDLLLACECGGWEAGLGSGGGLGGWDSLGGHHTLAVGGSRGLGIVVLLVLLLLLLLRVARVRVGLRLGMLPGDWRQGLGQGGSWGTGCPLTLGTGPTHYPPGGQTQQQS